MASPAPVPLQSIALAALVICIASPCRATVQFQKVFVDEYLAEHSDREFVEYVRTKAKCFTCHQGSKHRQNHNAYGRVLAELLDAPADNKDSAKIVAVLREMESRAADPSMLDGTTFGQRIAASRLPAGELDDAKREPE